jgi:hypothetical protein
MMKTSEDVRIILKQQFDEAQKMAQIAKSLSDAYPNIALVIEEGRKSSKQIQDILDVLADLSSLPTKIVALSDNIDKIEKTIDGRNSQHLTNDLPS